MGMHPGWSMGVEGLSTGVRVLPPEKITGDNEKRGLQSKSSLTGEGIAVGPTDEVDYRD